MSRRSYRNVLPLLVGCQGHTQFSLCPAQFLESDQYHQGVLRKCWIKHSPDSVRKLGNQLPQELMSILDQLNRIATKVTPELFSNLKNPTFIGERIFIAEQYQQLASKIDASATKFHAYLEKNQSTDSRSRGTGSEDFSEDLSGSEILDELCKWSVQMRIFAKQLREWKAPRGPPPT